MFAISDRERLVYRALFSETKGKHQVSQKIDVSSREIKQTISIEESLIHTIIQKRKIRQVAIKHKPERTQLILWDDKIPSTKAITKHQPKSVAKTPLNRNTSVTRTLHHSRTNHLPQIINQGRPEEHRLPMLASNNLFTVRVSHKTPIQGSTLAIYLYSNKKPKVLAATFAKRKIRFLKISKYTYRSFVGLDIEEKTGTKKLNIIVLPFNKPPLLFSADIRVKKKFPFVRLANGKLVSKEKMNPIAINISNHKKLLFSKRIRMGERKYFLSIFSKISKIQYWKGLFIYPIKNSESRAYSFGRYRTYWLNGKYLKASYHRGIDIAMPRGTPVMSSNNGIVVAAGYFSVRGFTVVVDHGFGVYSSYYHLSAVKTKVGHFVKGGDVIGLVGSTGLSTGNHLHWALQVTGRTVDPHQWCINSFTFQNAHSIAKKTVPIKGSIKSASNNILKMIRKNRRHELVINQKDDSQ